MPNDALAVLQGLAARLGRQPTLTELYAELGVPPSGQPSLPAPALPASASMPASLRTEGDQLEEDARVTGELRLREMADQNPELRQLREMLVQQMLFGLPAGLGEVGFPWALRWPGTGAKPLARSATAPVAGGSSRAAAR